ncbi:MAG: type II secretion system protein M [Thiobacillus sp.]|nr:type II secretion system protein M [Thiobacillus sp.]
MNALKQRWQFWAMRIDALSFRERILVFVAASGVVFSLIFIGLIEPALKQQETSLQTITALQQEISALREQVAASEQGGQEARDRELQRLRQAAAQIEQTVKQREGGLIPPEQMFAVMKSMLTAHAGLTLLSVDTSPAQPAVPPPVDAPEPASAPEKTAAPEGKFYKHGITLRVAGGYADFVDYLARLERMPWTLQWESVQIDASRHPHLVLTVKLNTLSRETTWARL